MTAEDTLDRSPMAGEGIGQTTNISTESSRRPYQYYLFKVSGKVRELYDAKQFRGVIGKHLTTSMAVRRKSAARRPYVHSDHSIARGHAGLAGIGGMAIASARAVTTGEVVSHG